ncbi:acyl-CoA dehydrogenase family protein [Pelagerythrobacter aerophilus]
MAFALDEQQQMIAETAAAFFAENATSERTRAAMANGIDRDLWRGYCRELGFGGLTVPEDLGGAGLGHVELAIVAEQAGRTLAAIPLLGCAMTTAALLASDDRAAIEAHLPAMMVGDRIVAAGERGGEGMLVPHAAQCDLLLLLCEGDAHLIDASAATVEPLKSLDETRPLARVLAPAGDPLPGGAAPCEAARATGVLCLAAEALGGAQEALDRTVAFAHEREQFGRPVGSFQAYKHRLADRAVEIEQARSAVWWAACALDEGHETRALALHAAKSFCADTYLRVAGDMIQLHGGIGFTWEHDAHLFFKRARAIANMLGDGPHHRERVARIMLDEAA